jgi:hypothetical protein
MSGEPTLRHGDKSADGWVELLQELLVNKGAHLTVDGDFGDETFRAVVAFQTDYELQDRSGVVGNETWSALRGDDEHAAPGSTGWGGESVDRGVKLRFWDYVHYDDPGDRVHLMAYSVGTQEPVEGSIELFVHLKDPDGHEYDVSAIHSLGDERRHNFTIYDATRGHAGGSYSGVAQLPSSAGGEIFAFAFNKIGLIDV